MNGFQHEQPDYWLTFGNPWEIERLIVSYPIKFYGHVSVHQEEGRQVRQRLGWGWVAGWVGWVGAAVGLSTSVCGWGRRRGI